jgi:hypothetical protein
VLVAKSWAEAPKVAAPTVMPPAAMGFWWQLAQTPVLSVESKSVWARFWPAPEPIRVADPLARVAWVVASR